MEAPRKEPTDREQFEPRLVERTDRAPATLALRDLTRWGPIVGGLVAAIATAAVLSVLAGALGLTATRAPAAGGMSSVAAVAGGIVLLISFFVGGYVAARTAGPGGALVAVVNSALVWAISLVFGILLTAIGLGSLVGLLGSAAPASSAATTTSLWVTFIGMIVALAAAVVGGLVGMHPEVEPYDTSR